MQIADFRFQELVRDARQKRGQPDGSQYVTELQIRSAAKVARAAAAMLADPRNFTRDGLSFDAEGRPISVWSHRAARRDAYGWLLKCAADTLNDCSGPRSASFNLSDLIELFVYLRTGSSIVSLNDDAEDGRVRIVEALTHVAELLDDYRFR